MKKTILLCVSCCLALCVIIVSCSKSVRIPMSYSVTDTAGITIPDIYIPDSGTYQFPIWVKFLTGFDGDKVSLSFSGLPADVKVTPDSFSAVPTYVAPFVFYTNGAAHAKYPITLTSYTPTSGYKYYKFNLGVIAAECTDGFIGTFTGKNACSPTPEYSFVATSTHSASYKNTMVVNNFGGYGTNVNVNVVLDCRDDSAFVPLGTYGNNVTMQGQGIFTGNQIIIWYNASSTPTRGAESCIDTLTLVP